MILENIEKAAASIGDLSTIMAKIAEGGITKSDMRYAFQVLSAAKDVGKIDFLKLPSEIALIRGKLDDETRNRLEVIFKSHFDLVDDDVEARVEAGFDALLKGIQAVQIIISLKGKMK